MKLMQFVDSLSCSDPLVFLFSKTRIVLGFHMFRHLAYLMKAVSGSKYLMALPGKREFPVTPQHDKKRNLSDITISPSSAEAKPKHTKAGSPMMSGILNR